MITGPCCKGYSGFTAPQFDCDKLTGVYKGDDASLADPSPCRPTCRHVKIITGFEQGGIKTAETGEIDFGCTGGFGGCPCTVIIPLLLENGFCGITIDVQVSTDVQHVAYCTPTGPDPQVEYPGTAYISFSQPMVTQDGSSGLYDFSVYWVFDGVTHCSGFTTPTQSRTGLNYNQIITDNFSGTGYNYTMKTDISFGGGACG